MRWVSGRGRGGLGSLPPISTSPVELGSPEYTENESSASSASSLFSWADEERTTSVIEEWEKIQRTLYDEEGAKVTQEHLLAECGQWKQIFPHLRVTGKKVAFATTEHLNYKNDSEETLIFHYDDDFKSRSNRREPFATDSNLRYDISKRSKFDFHRNHLDNLNSKNLHMEDIKQYSTLQTSHINRKNTSKLSTTNRVGTSSSLFRSEVSSSKWRQANTISPNIVLLNDQHKFMHHFSHLREDSASSLSSVVGRSENLKYKERVLQKGYSKNHNYYKFENDKHIRYLEPLSSHLPQSSNPYKYNEIKNISLPPLKTELNNNKRQLISNSNFNPHSRKVQSIQKESPSLIPVSIFNCAKINLHINLPSQEHVLFHRREK